MDWNQIVKHITEAYSPKQWIAIDFDGVIHSYSKGWHDGTPYDKVTEGCVEALQELRNRGYRIAIHTARVTNQLDLNGVSISNEQLKMLTEYLQNNNVPYDKIAPKIIAAAYIDDRAIYCAPLNEVGWDTVLANPLVQGGKLNAVD